MILNFTIPLSIMNPSKNITAKNKKERKFMNIGDKFYCSKCMREVEDDEISCPHCKYVPYSQKNPYALPEGTLLFEGRYQLGAVIGSGGFGITYAAWDIKLNHAAAIKEFFHSDICSRNTHESDTITITDTKYELEYKKKLSRFIHEARILGTLDNVKNIVPVFEWFEANNTAYIVMEYIHGVTLEDYVKKNNIPPQKIIEKMEEMIKSLILVHDQGFIHRDISPVNIMVNEEDTLILIDFGAAVREEAKNKTVILNQNYAPIEQNYPSEPQGPFTDVYALGATIYHLICKVPPQQAVSRKNHDNLKSPKELNVKLKRYQNKAIMKALNLMPEKRQQTMKEFHRNLYNLPLDEEEKKQKLFMFTLFFTQALIFILAILTILNMAYGLFFADGIRYSLHLDGMHVRGYYRDSEKISIPENIMGIKVVQIDEAAFQGAENLKEIEIPSTINTINKYVFNGCVNLQNVKVPDTINTIAPEAFTNTHAKLTLLGNLDTDTENAALANNLNYADIETVNNENGITITKYNTHQKNIIIPDFLNGRTVNELDSMKNEPVFAYDTTNIILPASLDKIGDYALSEVSIKNIILPDTLKYIGNYAFSQALIEAVVLPDSVEFLGDNAFSPCLYLEAVRLSSNLRAIPQRCFSACRSLVLVIIPEGITQIKQYAFDDCVSLEFINLPETLKRMEQFVFTDCTALKSIYVPKSLGIMDASDFEGCMPSLNIIGYKGTFAEYFSAKNKYKFFDLSSVDENIMITEGGYMLIKPGMQETDTIKLPEYSSISKSMPAIKLSMANNLKSKNVVLPSTLEEISTSAFMNNTYIESADLPNTLDRIMSAAFQNCKNLESINFNEGLDEIGIQAFYNCAKLSNIKLPSTLKAVGNFAFYGCKNITEINIPEAMSILDFHSFSGTGVKNITIPGNIIKINKSFTECENLVSADFLDGIKYIHSPFENCINLEYVTIPESAAQLGRSTFMNCKNLKDVWIYSDNITMDYMNDKTKTYTYLFADSPNVTIHAHRGSNAHIYADIHKIKFAAIPKSDDIKTQKENISFIYDGRLYTDEELINMITPAKGQTKDLLWGKFRYALGYGFIDLANKCLDAYEEAGDKYDKIWADCARLFMTQNEYKCGLGIAFFENYQEHPVLKAGDIIVEVEGEEFNSYEDFSNKIKAHNTPSKKLTILRADENKKISKLEILNEKGQPLFAVMDIIPLTFEENY